MSLLTEALNGALHALLLAAPFMLLGLLAAGVLHVLLPETWIARFMGRPGLGGVVRAGLVGIPLPVCSCGVVPIAGTLRRKGASRSATTAFLITTPESSMDSILLTWGLMGPVMAIARPVAAFFTALLAGGWSVLRGPGASESEPPPVVSPSVSPLAVKRAWWREALAYAFGTMMNDLVLWFLLGILLAGFIGALLPENFAGGWWSTGPAAMGLALVAGIPMYLCASASTPIAAALMAKGMGPGPALVFLLAGPATNAATLVMLARLFGRRFLVGYLVSIAAGALLAGILLEALLAATGWSFSPRLSMASVETVGWWAWGSAAIFLAIGLYRIFRGAGRQSWREMRENLRTMGRLWGNASGLWVVVAALAAASTFAACSRAPRSDGGVPTVVVSVAPQAYFVERLAEGRVRVLVMIPPAANPATYEPSMEQLRILDGAAVYLKLGHPNFPFEKAWLDRLVGDGAGFQTIPVWRGESVEHGDPHVWTSPEGGKLIADATASALAELLPEAAAEITANREQLFADIDALDAELQSRFEGLAGRRFYVFHPAWGSFARAYGLTQVSIEEDGKEPSPDELAHLIRDARERGVSTIFVEPQFSHRSAEVIAREIGAEVQSVDPLARDWLNNLKDVSIAFAEAAR